MNVQDRSRYANARRCPGETDVSEHVTFDIKEDTVLGNRPFYPILCNGERVGTLVPLAEVSPLPSLTVEQTDAFWRMLACDMGAMLQRSGAYRIELAAAKAPASTEAQPQ